MAKKAEVKREKSIKTVPESKLKLVEDLANEMKSHKTILIASTKGLPSSQFHKIKKALRGRADIRIAKKTMLLRAIEKSEKGALQNLKEHIKADVALFFSDIDAFELSGILIDNFSPAKARAGEIAPEDISIEPGPTDLIPGPAISELSSVGLKVAVENGKLAIKTGVIVTKAGQPIKANVASVLGKLGIAPMKVGFEPLVAYDAVSDKVYVGIKIDKKGVLAELRSSIGKAMGFAVNMGYAAKDTIKFIIAKAGMQEKAIENLVQKTTKEEAK